MTEKVGFDGNKHQSGFVTDAVRKSAQPVTAIVKSEVSLRPFHNQSATQKRTPTRYSMAGYRKPRTTESCLGKVGPESPVLESEAEHTGYLGRKSSMAKWQKW